MLRCARPAMACRPRPSRAPGGFRISQGTFACGRSGTRLYLNTSLARRPNRLPHLPNPPVLMRSYAQHSAPEVSNVPSPSIDNDDKKAKEDESKGLMKSIRNFFHHMWVGTKLLSLNVRVSSAIVYRLLQGKSLTRRENRLLRNTITDLFRLVPFSVFVIIPFMEFFLPLALKLFPNMLPSTFEDKLKKEEDAKRTLRAKLGVAKFLQDAMQEMAVKREDESFGDDFEEFMKRVREGEVVTASEVEKYSRLFEDEFTLENISRPLLVAMCKFLGLTPYGTSQFLQWQLENRLQQIRIDDETILSEGAKSLDFAELQQACAARGMKHLGISKLALKAQLEGWLDMTERKVPAVLALLSRVLMITAEISTDDAIKETLSQLPDTVVEEAESKADIYAGKPDMALQLEVLKHEYEKMVDEEEEAEETKEDIEDVTTPSEHQEKVLLDVANVVAALASSSSTLREREELEALVRGKGREVGDAEETETNLVKERLASRIRDVLRSIESDVEEVDALLQDKMNVIDKDRDGVVTTREIASAVALMRDKPTDEEIREVIGALDFDHDGKVSLEYVASVRSELAKRGQMEVADRP